MPVSLYLATKFAMYNEYFGFKESPFSIAPDPRYLYMSEQHREALAHLIYGFNSDGGFVLLTGEVGTGKTTVCRCLLEQIPENSAIAFIINPKLTVEELLATICDEFGIRYPKDNKSIKVFVDLINAYLLDAHASGRKAVLIIDEAQNLSDDVLEQLRLLTNLETNQRKLLQIILLGQPELRDKLSRPELRQVSQRIIARYHLGALSKDDVGAYVTHRLSVAGTRDQLFPASTINELYRISRGVPRLINILCDRALLGTFAGNKNEVNKSILTKAAREVFGGSTPHRDGQMRKTAWILSALILIIVGVVLAATYYKDGSQETAVSKTVKPVTTKSSQVHDLHWPDNQPVNQSRNMAFQNLFRLWNIPYKPDSADPACTQARANGLRCYEGIGSLDNLRNLDRPAVLKIFDDRDREYYATLISLNEDSAVFIVGTETREVPIKDIGAYWLGEYTLLWRPPPDYVDTIKPGSQGPVVEWLDMQLAGLQDRTVLTQEDKTFNDELVNHVKKFQLARGLIPDGIVGAQTLIHLNSAIGSNMPTLTERQEDN